jgi:hypothetical protein
MSHAKALRRPAARGATSTAHTAANTPAAGGNPTAGVPGSAAAQPLTRRQISATLRGLIVLVTWNVILFARYALLTDATFPIEALLPIAYAAGCVFLRHDELRLAKTDLLREAVVFMAVSALLFDLNLAEVLVRAMLVVGALQWCHLRLALAVAAAFIYLGFNCAIGASLVPEVREPFVAVAVHGTLGLCVAFTVRMNRLCIVARGIFHAGTDQATAATVHFFDTTPGIAFFTSLYRRFVHPQVTAVVYSRPFAEFACWWALMLVDWTQGISLGGLAISACLVVGFCTSLAQDRGGTNATASGGPAAAPAAGGSGRTRYVYQCLLIGAVLASDVSIFLAAPVRTLPFVANCVISAYFVLYCAAPSSSPPKLTRKPGKALEITPVPPRATSTLLPAALWAAMTGIDLFVQTSRGWEQPSLGRALLSVNTAGYGILMLTSTFLEAFSRDARVRARMLYLEDEGTSPDAVALRQLVEDVETSSELAHVLAGVGIDVADVASGEATALFASADDTESNRSDTPATPAVAEAAPPADNAAHRAETPAIPYDSESSEASEAGTAAANGSQHTPHHHNNNNNNAVANTSESSVGGSYQQPAGGSSRKGTPAASNTPDASRQASFAGAPTASDGATASGAGDDAESTQSGAAAAAARKETAEEAAAREKARREADEARRRLKQQQKIEAQRQHEQRLAEAAERKEKQRREQEVSEVLDGERRARDSIVSKEKNAREKMHSGHLSDVRGIVAASRARKEREERQKRQAAEEEARKAAAEKKGREREQRAKELHAQQQAKAAAEAAAKAAKEQAAAKAAAATSNSSPKSGKSMVPLPRSANEKAVAAKSPATPIAAPAKNKPGASTMPMQQGGKTSPKLQSAPTPTTPAARPSANPSASSTPAGRRDRPAAQHHSQQHSNDNGAASAAATTTQGTDDGQLLDRLMASLSQPESKPQSAADQYYNHAFDPAPASQMQRSAGDDDDAWNFINNQVQSVLDENAVESASSPASGKTFGEPASANHRKPAFPSAADAANPGSFTVAAPSSGASSPAPPFGTASDYRPVAQPVAQPVAYSPANMVQPSGGQYVYLPDGTVALIMPQQIPGAGGANGVQMYQQVHQPSAQAQYYSQAQYAHYGTGNNGSERR